MIGDYHSAAYWLAGRAVYAVRRGMPLGDLDIRDPDVVLAAAVKEIDAALAQPVWALADVRRKVLESLMAGAAAQKNGAARNAEWAAAMAPLSESLSIRNVAQGSRRFVSDNWSEILRLARTLLSERRLTAHMLGWILDPAVSRKLRQAA
jgi:hypothetical protein